MTKKFLLFFCYFLLTSGCFSRYSADDQYSYDGIFMIPSTEWYARMVDITGEKYKAFYLSKDLQEIEGPLDRINGPVIWINKTHETPDIFISNDSIVLGVESFKVTGDTSLCRRMKSATIDDELFIEDNDLIKEVIDKYDYLRVLPRYPYVIVEFETWHNSFHVVPNWEYLNQDTTIIHRSIEPLRVTTKSFREQGITPGPLLLIRLRASKKVFASSPSF